MDRSRAIELLPETYAQALRLHEAGREEAIPERLGIAPEAVGALLELARAKLATLVEAAGGPGPEAQPARLDGGHPGARSDPDPPSGGNQ